MSGSFQRNGVLGNFQVTTLVLLAPMLAFLRPLLLFIGKATFFTNIEGLPVSLYLFDHCSFHSVYLVTLPAFADSGGPEVWLWRLRQRQQLSASRVHQLRRQRRKGRVFLFRRHN